MQNGTRIGTYMYDAYGNITALTESDTLNNPIRYAGEYYDEESGNYYLRARYYNPSLGRFMAEDPAMDGQNWYAYCYSNPIRYIDPTGLQPALAQKFKTWCEDTFIGELLYEETQNGSLNWFYKKVGFYRDSSGVFHARDDAWQFYFGYNNAYDAAFNLGTSMQKQKFDFAFGEDTFILWMWKGDYLNLGMGAEVALYKNNIVFDETHVYGAKDYELPMSIQVYYNDTKIISHYDTTWWITGFNPYYHGIDASSLEVIATIDFSGQPVLWENFYETYKSQDFYFNCEDKKVTISW